MTFGEVFSRELEVVRTRRAKIKELSKDAATWLPNETSSAKRPGVKERPEETRDTDQGPKALRHAQDLELAGLSFSGGGIRSATFGLGILQGLADMGLLHRFDYLSTVSGGGYIGSWLAAWMKRDGDPLNVEQQLKPNREQEAEARRLLRRRLVAEEEPEPIYHLRAYSNYLSPKLGALSLDSWTLVSLYLRNLLLNLTVLLPAVLALIAGAHLWLHASYDPDFVHSKFPLVIVLSTLAALLLFLLRTKKR
jgi:Patatin-like phospholipase